MADLLLLFTGDLLVDRAIPSEAFSKVEILLREADIVFGNLEGAYTDDPHPAPSATVIVGPAAHNLDVFADVGFDVLSLANNHILDVGYAAMRETITRLTARGIQTCGAGNDIAEARRPAIVEARGTRASFLAYASIFPAGYDARSNRPGLVPIREHRYWSDLNPNYYSSQIPQFTTVADEHDLDSLSNDIELARREADLVVASFHWGDYLRPFVLTEHERRVARYSIDCGADLVLGHHHHALRGIEWYNGKPIFYGLGHFVFDCKLEPSEALRRLELDPDPNTYAVAPREGWPLLPLHPDTRMTVLGWARVIDGRIRDVGFLPCELSADGLVHPLDCQSERGQEVISYVTKCIESEKLNGRITTSNLVLGEFETMQVEPC